jgi:hypothetical protein
MKLAMDLLRFFVGIALMGMLVLFQSAFDRGPEPPKLKYRSLCTVATLSSGRTSMVCQGPDGPVIVDAR